MEQEEMLFGNREISRGANGEANNYLIYTHTFPLNFHDFFFHRVQSYLHRFACRAARPGGR